MSAAPAPPAPPAPTRRPAPTGPRRTRQAARALHLVVGGLLATHVYLPPSLAATAALRWVLVLAGVPLVAASGLFLWKQAAVRRLLARRR
ncbi:hypothetical protein [Geodermatophilus sp. SYSU D00710]